MRIVSLLSSATEIVCALGLRERLVGITHECDYPPGIRREKPAVIESCVDPEGPPMSSAEIDRRVREAVRSGEGVYRIKFDLLRELKPDLVITQGLCDVCAVPRQQANEAVQKLEPPPKLLSLDPTGLDDILRNIGEVGEVTGRRREAAALVDGLKARIARVETHVRTIPADERPGVALIEWLDPLFTAGHWAPEMAERAGGRDLLGKPGEPSRQIAWDEVLSAAPDVIVAMVCGYSIARTRSEARLLTSRVGWRELPAVKTGRVYLVDANAYFSRPGPRIVDGFEQLARIFHPDRFPVQNTVWQRL